LPVVESIVAKPPPCDALCPAISHQVGNEPRVEVIRTLVKHRLATFVALLDYRVDAALGDSGRRDHRRSEPVNRNGAILHDLSVRSGHTDWLWSCMSSGRGRHENRKAGRARCES
jgi:hypothetical protein